MKSTNCYLFFQRVFVWHVYIHFGAEQSASHMLMAREKYFIFYQDNRLPIRRHCSVYLHLAGAASFHSVHRHQHRSIQWNRLQRKEKHQ